MFLIFFITTILLNGTNAQKRIQTPECFKLFTTHVKVTILNSGNFKTHLMMSIYQILAKLWTIPPVFIDQTYRICKTNFLYVQRNLYLCIPRWLLYPQTFFFCLYPTCQALHVSASSCKWRFRMKLGT